MIHSSTLLTLCGLVILTSLSQLSRYSIWKFHDYKLWSNSDASPTTEQENTLVSIYFKYDSVAERQTATTYLLNKRQRHFFSQWYRDIRRTRSTWGVLKPWLIHIPCQRSTCSTVKHGTPSSILCILKYCKILFRIIRIQYMPVWRQIASQILPDLHATIDLEYIEILLWWVLLITLVSIYSKWLSQCEAKPGRIMYSKKRATSEGHTDLLWHTLTLNSPTQEISCGGARIYRTTSPAGTQTYSPYNMRNYVRSCWLNVVATRSQRTASWSTSSSQECWCFHCVFTVKKFSRRHSTKYHGNQDWAQVENI